MNYSESFGLTYLKDRSFSYRNHPVGLSNMQSKNYISGTNHAAINKDTRNHTHVLLRLYCVTRGCTLYFREHSMKVYFFLG